MDPIAPTQGSSAGSYYSYSSDPYASYQYNANLFSSEDKQANQQSQEEMTQAIGDPDAMPYSM